MNRKIPPISEAEWHVMEVAWSEGRVTANRVVEVLNEPHDWHPKTIRTMIDRLVKKGALACAKTERVYTYTPAIDRDACVKEASRSLLERAFGGTPASMLAYFAKHEPLTDEQIDRLQQLLEQRKGGNR